MTSSANSQIAHFPMTSTRHEEKEEQPNGEFRWVHPSELYSKKQVRRFSWGDLGSLGESMREHQINPIVVCPKDDKGYPIYMGERRWRAATTVGLDKVLINVIEEPQSTVEKIFRQFAENEDREELDPFEKGQAVIDLIDAGVPQDEIARRLGKSPGWVSIAKAMMSLPGDIKELYTKGAVHDPSTLYELKNFRALDPDRYQQYHARILKEGVTRTQAKTWKKKAKAEKERKKADEQSQKAALSGTQPASNDDPHGTKEPSGIEALLSSELSQAEDSLSYEPMTPDASDSMSEPSVHNDMDMEYIDSSRSVASVSFAYNGQTMEGRLSMSRKSATPGYLCVYVEGFRKPFFVKASAITLKDIVEI